MSIFTSLFFLRPLGGSFAGSIKSLFASLTIIRMVMVCLESSGSVFSQEQSQLRSRSPPLMTLPTSVGDFDPSLKADDSSTIKSRSPDTTFDGTMPACTRGVILTLHRKDGQDQDDTPCKGLLLRDDIILTTNECSKFSFTFAFPGEGDITAVPHRSLNSKDGIDSRLGFLEANPSYHYHFIDRPVRRNRMFLSHRSSPGDEDTPIAMSCTHEDRPIAHNFPVNGELIPLGHLNSVLQNDVLWEETDLQVAHGLQNGSQRWYDLPITLEQEKEIMLQLIKKYQGPQGSIDIVSCRDGYVEQASAVMEPGDPRGHRKDKCFRYFYHRYRLEEPFSGQRFFDWLDFGVGKNLLEQKKYKKVFYDMGEDRCVKNNFDQEKIHYFTDLERSMHEVKFEMSNDGKDLIATYAKSGELVPKSGEDDPHLYIWDLNETFYIVDGGWDEKKYGTLKHTGPVSAAPVLSAGEAFVGGNGSVWGIDFASGHYRPQINAVALMYQWMKKKNFNLTALHWIGRAKTSAGGTSWTAEDCDDMIWEHFEMPGYDAASLNRSCYEVTTSPTWMVKEDS